MHSKLQSPVFSYIFTVFPNKIQMWLKQSTSISVKGVTEFLMRTMAGIL